MAQIMFHPLSTEIVTHLRRGGRDAYGCAPEHVLSDGGGNPCRHCLNLIPDNAGMLVLAHRPFDGLHPYAETGPIFLCADSCDPWTGTGLPPILNASPDYLLKGYTPDQRIRYGTGRIVGREDLAAYAATLLERDEISFVDVRSARNNCFLTRITRAA